jgi:hypothetical protein
VVLAAIIDGAGQATVDLPAAAGTNPAAPPLVACYISSPSVPGVWLVVADGNTTSTSNTFCGLVFNYSGRGVWDARILNAPVGWNAAFVVVY